MRLSDFITQNMERVLAEWELFASESPPGEHLDRLALRDHAENMLRALILDMGSAQSPVQQDDKSKGGGRPGPFSRVLNTASRLHAAARVTDGFDLPQMVSEYRALRASVIRLWRESHPAPDANDLADLGRFHEAIDQSLATAVERYTELVDRARNIFLAILGHDLRNPLAAIKMSALVLSLPSNASADATLLASGIAASAKAMDGIITDLLQFAGGKLGAAMPVSLSRFDMQTLCDEVVAEIRAAFPGATLLLELKPSDCIGCWDRGRVRQVVSNLLGNAIQHGAGAITLTVGAFDGAQEVVVTVHNTGPVIEPKLLQTIFDPLVRASESARRTDRSGSLGLGLYIAREIARGHGGTVDVESTEVAGTTFSLRLPKGCSSPSAAAAEVPAAA